YVCMFIEYDSIVNMLQARHNKSKPIGMFSNPVVREMMIVSILVYDVQLMVNYIIGNKTGGAFFLGLLIADWEAGIMVDWEL
ncbi:hypothetical protein ACJX0J_006746, partial [Zea mays]